jgi:hypothetical protein
MDSDSHSFGGDPVTDLRTLAVSSLGLIVLACSGSIANPNENGAGPSGTSGTSGSGGSSGGGSGGSAGSIGVTETNTCTTPEQSFSWELYGPVFSRCIGCHNEFGLARQQNLNLRLTFPGEPDFAERNVRVLTEYATTPTDTPEGTMPILLAKPTGRIEHVGGEVLPKDSNEAALLKSFVEKLSDPPACTKTPEDIAATALGKLTLASPRATYARAKFVLTGELATPEEMDGLPDTEAMLGQKLDELMQTEAFLVRSQEMYGDSLLTDAYSSLVRGDQLLNQLRDYPQNSYYLPLCTPERTNNCCDSAEETCCGAVSADPAACTDALNDLAIDAVAREPLELVRHVVRHDLPLTELVTANYALVNPYSATIYGVSDAHRASLFDADAANDANEFKVLALSPTAQNALRASPDSAGAYPHVGILTMPSSLVRYPSSTSNQQRTRGARLVLERLLAIPVMKLSDFSTAKLPLDADLELATQQYPACTVCHAAIDPIAGHFKNFGPAGEYRPGGNNGGNRNNQSHLPPASFLDATQPTTDTRDPVRWLAEQVARHDRYALGVLMPVLADLIGTEILTPPTDTLGEDYQAKYVAYRMQQLEIQRLRREFAGPFGLRLKPLVKAIVMGPFFRAVGTTETDETARRALALAGVGPGTLLTPEQLARKIESATGITYRASRDPAGRDLFRSFRDYRLMFGGTDWDATPERYREPNAMSVRIALRMGNEVSCVAVAQDLSLKNPAARKLFPNVTLTTTPEAGGEATIRTEIRRLHRWLLNEELPDGDPELEATYQLWVAARNASRSTGTGGRGGGTFRCGATTSFTPAKTAYPDDAHDAISTDTDGTVRAWMAVTSYLLADGRFFLQ